MTVAIAAPLKPNSVPDRRLDNSEERRRAPADASDGVDGMAGWRPSPSLTQSPGRAFPAIAKNVSAVEVVRVSSGPDKELARLWAPVVSGMLFSSFDISDAQHGQAQDYALSIRNQISKLDYDPMADLKRLALLTKAGGRNPTELTRWLHQGWHRYYGSEDINADAEYSHVLQAYGNSQNEARKGARKLFVSLGYDKNIAFQLARITHPHDQGSISLDFSNLGP